MHMYVALFPLKSFTLLFIQRISEPLLGLRLPNSVVRCPHST